MEIRGPKWQKKNPWGVLRYAKRFFFFCLIKISGVLKNNEKRKFNKNSKKYIVENERVDKITM